MDYRTELDRLSFHAEFLRREMAAGLQAKRDVAELHVALDAVRSKRLELAMSENVDWDGACLELDASQARAKAMPLLPGDVVAVSVRVRGQGALAQ